jgi:hypothetical protein
MVDDDVDSLFREVVDDGQALHAPAVVTCLISSNYFNLGERPRLDQFRASGPYHKIILKNIKNQIILGGDSQSHLEEPGRPIIEIERGDLPDFFGPFQSWRTASIASVEQYRCLNSLGVSRPGSNVAEEHCSDAAIG